VKVEKRGSGRALVYLHPAGGVRFTPLLDKLARTHTLHFPIFPELHTHPSLAIAVADYIGSEIGQPCDVLGASFGGAVALWLAIEHAQWVDHLVLECPAGLQTIDGAEAGRAPALLDRVSAIAHATLILHGTGDRIVTADSMRLLKSRLKRAFLVYVWDAAHDIEVDQPERMAAVVESFLERSEAFVVPYA
jgi:pimeloyl-ACP methyl ester carboxylesterase